MKIISLVLLITFMIVGCSSQSHQYDSQIKSIISDSLDSITLPLIIWAGYAIADSVEDDTIGLMNYDESRSPRWVTTSESVYARVLNISYYHLSTIDSIEFRFDGTIAFGGEDGYVRLGVIGVDSVEVYDDNSYTENSIVINMIGEVDGIVNVQVEIYTTDQNVPFKVHPLCLIGYYKLR